MTKARPKKLCAGPGCFKAIYGTYCDTCMPKILEQRKKADEAWREKRRQQVEAGLKADYGYLYNGAWRRLRTVYLKHHPLCVACQSRGIVTEATEVDHIKPHRGDHQLFYDPENFQALCTPCHSRKTASEDGGFGNKKQG